MLRRGPAAGRLHASKYVRFPQALQSKLPSGRSGTSGVPASCSEPPALLGLNTSEHAEAMLAAAATAIAPFTGGLRYHLIGSLRSLTRLVNSPASLAALFAVERADTELVERDVVAQLDAHDLEDRGVVLLQIHHLRFGDQPLLLLLLDLLDHHPLDLLAGVVEVADAQRQQGLLG